MRPFRLHTIDLFNLMDLFADISDFLEQPMVDWDMIELSHDHTGRQIVKATAAGSAAGDQCVLHVKFTQEQNENSSEPTPRQWDWTARAKVSDKTGEVRKILYISKADPKSPKTVKEFMRVIPSKD